MVRLSIFVLQKQNEMIENFRAFPGFSLCVIYSPHILKHSYYIGIRTQRSVLIFLVLKNSVIRFQKKSLIFNWDSN